MNKVDSMIIDDLSVPKYLIPLLRGITKQDAPEDAIETFAEGCIENFLSPQEVINALDEVQSKIRSK